MRPKVAIIMGSDSDLDTMKDAAVVLTDFNVEFDITIVSAHRTPERLFDFAKNADSTYEVIIAGAGGAAHLPGMVASMTTLPVIGVPIKTSALSGVDSLHSIVQMPPGVPVATVAIGNAKNAGLLALQILGIKYPEIKAKMADFRRKQTDEVIQKANNLEKLGFEKYLMQKKV